MYKFRSITIHRKCYRKTPVISVYNIIVNNIYRYCGHFTNIAKKTFNS